MDNADPTETLEEIRRSERVSRPSIVEYPYERPKVHIPKRQIKLETEEQN